MVFSGFQTSCVVLEITCGYSGFRDFVVLEITCGFRDHMWF